ncbi:formate dehydrogenase subunit gamma [Nevskia sp.]|uniref:formate dehydrogenase subunit gamma n=1 Tax=Nevskia sp. TaxID=1929292 RepID=UPI0025E4E038|nr:formate dehydrogenase subunit gamma [Nevskia sp.]
MSTSTFERKPPIKLAELSSLSPSDLATVNGVLAKLKDLPGALLPVLHGIQDALGHVPKDAVPMVAKSLNLSRAEVHGVVSFYHWYRTEKPGAHVIHLCRAEACQAVGGRALETHVKAKLGIDFHETTADRRYTLEPAYCLGNCAVGPSLLIDMQLKGRVTPERFDRLTGAMA